VAADVHIGTADTDFRTAREWLRSVREGESV
jgi:hypothetical protein